MTNNTPGDRHPTNTTTDNARPGASQVQETTPRDDRTNKAAMYGTEETVRGSNVSWGSIIAGVVTFFAVTILLSMIPTALGLGGSSGTVLGVWAAVVIVLALAAAGFVSGALATRGGVFHGFLTWATSLLALLILVGWLGSSVLGAIGGALGGAAGTVADQTNITQDQAQGAASQAQDAAEQARQNIDQQDINQAQQQVDQAADTASTGVWWVFAGTLAGAVVAALCGGAGARSVANKRRELTTAGNNR